jgi:hypothetical protein
MDEDDKWVLKVVGFIILLFIILPLIFGKRDECHQNPYPPSCDLGNDHGY